MSPKEQVEGLMDELLQFAKKMLDEHGEFHPFGGYLTAPTTMVHVGVELKGTPQNAQKRLDTLVESLRKSAPKSLAFGIVSNVTIPVADKGKSDAVKVFLEHRDGYCAEVFFCYEPSAAGGIEFTDTMAQQGEPMFFAVRH